MIISMDVELRSPTGYRYLWIYIPHWPLRSEAGTENYSYYFFLYLLSIVHSHLLCESIKD